MAPTKTSLRYVACCRSGPPGPRLPRACHCGPATARIATARNYPRGGLRPADGHRSRSRPAAHAAGIAVGGPMAAAGARDGPNSQDGPNVLPRDTTAGSGCARHRSDPQRGATARHESRDGPGAMPAEPIFLSRRNFSVAFCANLCTEPHRGAFCSDLTPGSVLQQLEAVTAVRFAQSYKIYLKKILEGVRLSQLFRLFSYKQTKS